jgi:predicted acetyltransferase
MRDIKLHKARITDSRELSELNLQLIKDEGSSNKMSDAELESRMRRFLQTDYDAYLFKLGDETVGYALVQTRVSPVYLRQFFISRKFRRRGYGKEAFQILVQPLAKVQ